MRVRRYPCIRQNNETECGAACLASVCSFYGRPAELSQIREFACVDKYGANLLGLKSAACALGFAAEGLSGTIEELKAENLRCPYIAHIIKDGILGHFIVVFEHTDNGFTAGDPAVGLVHYTTEEFEKVWTGHVLALTPREPADKAKKARRPNRPFASLFPLVFRQKRQILAIAVVSFAATVLSVAASFFAYYLFDIVIPRSLFSQLLAAAGIAAAVHLMIFALHILRTRMIAVLSKQINYSLFCRYIASLLHIDHRFYERFTTGDLVTRLQDTDIVREALSQVTITVSLDVIMMAAGAAALAVLDWRLLLISLCIMLLYGISIAAFDRPISSATAKMREKDAMTTNTFLETIHGIEDIKAYALEPHMFSKNEENIGALMEAFRHGTVVYSTQSILASTMMSVGEIVVLSTGAVEVMAGSASVGTVIMFYSLFAMCISPVKNMIGLLPTIRRAEISAQRLQDVFSAPSEADCEPSGGEDLPLNGELRVADVSFRYGNRELILDRLSLQIKAGERVALLGSSGSGKSTLIKLLLRFYPAESGEIYLGGRDIRSIPLNVLRDQIAYISQTPHLFRGSIAENICIGIPENERDGIIRFLEHTPYHDVISLFPMGWHTMLADNGENLSGGQRQMIVVGRALAKQAEILILDEATSAIDQETKKLIHQAIDQVYANKTILVVSHDAAETLRCDRSIVLKNGRAVPQEERGAMEIKGTI